MAVDGRRSGDVRRIILFFLVCIRRASQCAALCNTGDSSSLLEFKAGFIDGAGVFSTWKASKDCCQWIGVNCSSVGRVQGLTVQVLDPDDAPIVRDPSYGRVVGESLGNLTALEVLSITDVYFNADVPTTWGHLLNLKTLDLTCNFTGAIPSEFGLLKDLVTWTMDQMSVPAVPAGLLPSEVCNLTKLEDVDLSSMGITGEIPSCLHMWRGVVSLSMWGNFFTGPIPSVLGNLSLLQSLDLSDNLLSGSIPVSILKLPALDDLGLSENWLSGHIPTEIGDMQALSILLLSGNSLTGTIPASLGRLPKLIGMFLSSNDLSGTIPAELGNLTMCQVISISGNFLSGHIPPELGKIPYSAKLYLEVSNNNLSGPIPDTFGNFTRISAGGNYLTGGIPLSLASAHSVILPSNKLNIFKQVGPLPETMNIGFIDLGSNLLGGALPEWLSNLTSLYWINLSQNNLEGVIPVSLLTLPDLHHLNLSHNSFASELPSGSFRSTLLELSLQGNYFHGSISVSFLSCFSNLLILDLRNNSLSGSIPTSMGHLMKKLLGLDLSRNNLSGVIPDSLSDMVQVDLSQNWLTGSIPSFGNYSRSQIRSLVRLIEDGNVSSPLAPSFDLSNNFLTGNLPESLIYATSSDLIQPGYGGDLVRLRVGNNHLGGEMPDLFGSCDSLQSLSLHNNRFQGNLPASLQNCSNLAVLDLGWNELDGNLPSWLNNLAANLRVLMIGSNNFDGVLPAWLSNFTSLQVLDLSDNKFSGPMPPSLNQLNGLLQPGQLSSGSNSTLYQDEIQIIVKSQVLHYVYVLSTTTSLDLSGNRLSGNIPPQLGDLQGLRFLNLSQNNFSEGIPTILANMTSLESLDLSANQLNGSIPSQMAVDLTYLTYLNLSSNLLSGEIPYQNQFSTFSASSFAGNPGLCGPPLLVPCWSLQHQPPSSAPSPRHESFAQKWVSIPAFGVGVAIGFSLLSSFLLPFAYASGRKAKDDRTVPKRRTPYGVFRPP